MYVSVCLFGSINVSEWVKERVCEKMREREGGESERERERVCECERLSERDRDR